MKVQLTLPGGGPGRLNGDTFSPRSPAVDVAAFPILTEEVGFPPSPLAPSSSGRSAPSSGGPPGTPLGAIASKALTDVLGWKIKSDDPASFVGALNQSFSLSLVEGHVQWKWTPRSYAVQSDLSGGISGAQASVYMMAKTLLDQAMPLLDGLSALDPAADQEYVTALKAMTRSQWSELVNELGSLGGPRVLRVNQYFMLLLGVTISPSGVLTTPIPASGAKSYPDPEGVGGTLGQLRDQLGLMDPDNPDYINTIDDEQDVTNFRILSDYTVSLLNSWLSNLPFFVTTATPFLGTQLVLISRQLSVVSELVDEVRFVLDSVFIGPSERQTLQINLAGTPMFLEDILTWIQKYVTEEAPGIIQTGGRFALGGDFSQMVSQFRSLATGTALFASTSPTALSAPRVILSLNKLTGSLTDLGAFASKVGRATLAPRP